MPRGGQLIQPTPRIVAGKTNGRRGGLATAQRHGQEFCERRAEKGGNKLLELYGIDYFKHIRAIGMAKQRAEKRKQRRG